MTAINSNRAIRGPVTAVPVVAGKGVRLVADTENNRWVVEADETVLWEGTVPSTDGQNLNYTITLSEAITNFEIIRVFLDDRNKEFGLFELNPLSPRKKEMFNDGTGRNVIVAYYAHCEDSTHLTYQSGFGNNTWNTPYTGEDYGYGKPYKIVGINRIASN